MENLKLKFWYPAFAIFMFMPLTIFWQSKCSNIIYLVNIVNIFYFLIRFHNYYWRLLLDEIFIKLFVLFAFFSIASCVLNGILTFGIMYSLCAVYTVIMIIFIYSDSIVIRLASLFKVVIFLNFISYFLRGLLFRNVVAICLLGNKNDMAIFLIPMITVLMINHIQNKDNKSYWLSILGSVSMLFGSSGTGIMCGIISLIIILFYKYILVDKKLVIITMVVILFVLVSDHTSFLSPITSLLNKDVTFTYRTFIWQQSIEKILSSPLIGNGRGATTAMVNMYGSEVQRFISTHNLILGVFFEGGILLGTVFLNLYSKVLKSINRKTCIGRVSVLFVLCYFIVGLMESFSDNMMFWLFTTVIYLVNKKNSNE